ncbi:uncharacterized protein B0P05DRAFT_535111 [Gilbertella persicaria]|uniref:uncharacterized protein n=1 Tax=Gilbertella persicaria TaxID=101096 RepID=UPI00221ECE2D|nr:uncharacterized protein B0P05DRAFT_535111 [Gilbertella persicaria]KAI8084327.1 hypothetical protein B0P05DRAFT_535111 [Gilbertella persicaria]
MSDFFIGISFFQKVVFFLNDSIFFENGQGRILDEGGEGHDAMEVDPYHLQTLTRIRLYLKKQGSEQKPNDEGLDEEIVLEIKQQSNSYNQIVFAIQEG